jgi:putative membrane protein
MANEIATLEPPPSGDSTGRWELARQWAVAWKALKWSVNAFILIGFLMVIGQGFLFYRMFADIHPALGIGFVIVLAILLFMLVGRPLMSFFSTPVMARPPLVKGEKPTLFDLKARVAFDRKYLKALSRNPELKDARPAIADDLLALNRLAARVKQASEADCTALAGEIARFQAERIEARLAAIDVKVDRLIRAEAVGVGVATATSLNGTVDAFIVLWRAANLISRIARAYFGRPNLRGSLLILRDVAAIVVISRAADDISEMTGDVVGGLLGRMGGLVAGPVMDGAINATMTLKLGYLAKRRCRSFEAWTEEKANSLYAEAMSRVRRDAGAVITDLLKRVGGLSAKAASAAQATMRGTKNSWATVRSWFGRQEGAEPEVGS